jgi:hypothetical protein
VLQPPTFCKLGEKLEWLLLLKEFKILDGIQTHSSERQII